MKENDFWLLKILLCLKSNKVFKIFNDLFLTGCFFSSFEAMKTLSWKVEKKCSSLNYTFVNKIKNITIFFLQTKLYQRNLEIPKGHVFFIFKKILFYMVFLVLLTMESPNFSAWNLKFLDEILQSNGKKNPQINFSLFVVHFFLTMKIVGW